MANFAEDDRFDVSHLLPASREMIERVEGQLRGQLPADYADFMLEHNGGEGHIGEHYLILWGVDDLPRFNDAYEVEKYAPGFVLFGSSGGGEAFAFDMRTGSRAVMQVPFVGMSLQNAVRVAKSFSELLQRMRNEDELF